MKEITGLEIARAVAKLCITANTDLGRDITGCLARAAEKEESPVGRAMLHMLVQNAEVARRDQMPLCQDTGMAVVFAELGQDVHITGMTLQQAVDEGVRRGYEEGFLRMSIVGDPLRRENTGDNTPAVLHITMTEGDRLHLTVCPKGFGSENMSAMKMFTPSAAPEDIEDFIAEVAGRAGANPCPPVIMGVGLGGTVELAAILAKRALLRPVGEVHQDPYYAAMEQRALEKVNALGIGPQGLGGSTTALAVHIMPYPTHIAGMPCVVNMSCHVTRHAGCVL